MYIMYIYIFSSFPQQMAIMGLTEEEVEMTTVCEQTNRSSIKKS